MSAPKFFTHTCRKCNLTFRLLLRPDRPELFRMRCPDCRTRVLLDNRDAGLVTLQRRRLLSRPIREYELKPGIDYVDPNPEPPPPLELADPAIFASAHAGPSSPEMIASQEPALEKPASQNAALEEPTPQEPALQISALHIPTVEISAPQTARPVSDKPGRLHRLATWFSALRVRVRGSLDAAASLVYLTRYTVRSRARLFTESVLQALRGALRGLLTFGRAALEKTRAAVFAVFIAAATKIADAIAWLRESFSDGTDRLRVYTRSVLLRGRNARRVFTARFGDLGPAIARRLDRSRFYFPGALLERVSDASLFVRDAARLRFANWRDRVHDARRILWPERLPRRVLVGAYVGGPIVLFVVYLGASFVFPVLALPESIEVLQARLQPLQPNRILDREGGLVAELFARKTSDSHLVPAPGTAVDFPTSLRDKLLFVEDETFYEHGGVRPLAIVRAFFRNVAAGRYVEGGSTITQQVARMALRKHNRSLTRKFQEAVLCRQLELRLTKNEILNAYVNHVYMGHGAYGMQVAAEFFFNRPLTELNFAEELMLVTVLPAPTEYSPLRNPARLEQRMDLLYNRMVRENFARVPANEYRHQKNMLFAGMQEQSPNQSVFASRTNHAPYVAEYVRVTLNRLVRELAREQTASSGIFSLPMSQPPVSAHARRPRSEQAAGRIQIDPRYAAELFETGVTIHTSIDPALQRAATEETPRWIGDINPNYPPYEVVDGKPVRPTGLRESLLREYSDTRLGLQILGAPAPVAQTAHLQAAAIGVEPATGAVLFMQGGAGFRAGNQLNHAIAMRRQTGSAIKPFVYSAGIESGRVTAATILKDEPFPEDGPGPEEDPEWKPHNYRDDYHGKVSVRFALEKSLNIPAIQIAQRTGMSRLALQFQKVFFPTEEVFRARFRRDLTVAIGSLEMSPLEMAVAYTAFGNNGVVRRPYLIERIVARDGTVLFARGQDRQSFDEFELRIPEERRVLPGDVAHVMASLLKDSAKRGGAGYWSRYALGKTGTSNNYRDAWFVGVLPGVSAAVWIGYDDPANSMGRATGAAVAGPLWARIIASGLYGRSPGEFHFDPHGVYHEVCTKTGGLATPRCPHTRRELFTREHPPGRCWQHGS